MAVLEATGVPQPPDLRDVESIGNRLDIFVKRKFVMEEKRISKNYKGKAKEARRRTVAIQCCIVSKTGQIELCSATEIQNATTARLAVNRKAPHLPYTRDTLPAAKSAAELAYELSAAKERIRSAQMLAERAEQAMAAKVAEEFRVRSVKKRGVEMLAAQRTAYEDQLISERMLRLAAYETQEEEKKRLSASLRMQEQKAAEDAAWAQQTNLEARQDAARSLLHLEKAVRQMDDMRSRGDVMSKELACLRGKVERLGSSVTRAWPTTDSTELASLALCSPEQLIFKFPYPPL
ncbi:hypothetical protein AB1Y20_019926 [Prymnesium parvum]|uniref:Uncharacterized protein n=1 Tax=Prymnesium parvum TaxID=97485 RepID=A0AB34JVW0_PRYPA